MNPPSDWEAEGLRAISASKEETAWARRFDPHGTWYGLAQAAVVEIGRSYAAACQKGSADA